MRRLVVVLILCALPLAGWRFTVVAAHRPAAAVRPAARPGRVDCRAIIHVHTHFSGDGRAELPEIVDAARACGVTLVWLTDHDTQGYALTHQEGWQGDVLVLSGIETKFWDVEANVWGTGHLLILGAHDLPEPLGKRGWRDAAELAAAHGGLSIIAHAATARVPWKGGDDGISGAEMLNLFAGYDGASTLEVLGGALLSLANPDYGARVITGGPTGELAWFDAVARRRRLVGIGGADAHANIAVNDRIKIPFPSMKSLFAAMSTHLVLDRPLDPKLEVARAQAMAAVAAGHAYVARDGLADPTGFSFTARAGAVEHEMGAEVHGGPLEFAVRAPEVAGLKLRVVRDGEPVAEGSGPGLAYTAREPGAYRAEAWLRTTGAFFGVPTDELWITSNPVWLR